MARQNRKVTDLTDRERMQCRWVSMIQRCFYPLLASYVDYGERGITVDKAYMDFDFFLKDIGYPPDMNWTYSLDRIDVNGNYEPGNVRWASKSEQNRNRRKFERESHAYVITYKGETRSIKEWSAETGLKVNTIRYRLDKGYSPEKILTLPELRGIEYNGKTQSMSAWAREYKIPRKTLENRLKKMSLSEALTYERDWSQPINRKDNRMITANGKTQYVYQWARDLGVTPSAIYVRLRNGWTEIDAVTVPPKGDK